MELFLGCTQLLQDLALSIQDLQSGLKHQILIISRVYPDFGAFPKTARSAPGGFVLQPEPPWAVFVSFPNLSPALRDPCLDFPTSLQLFCVLDLSWMIPPCPCSRVP